MQLAITTVLYLEYERIVHIQDRRLSEERRRWWSQQRLHGLCHAVRQQIQTEELKYIEKRTKTSWWAEKAATITCRRNPPGIQSCSLSKDQNV